MTVFVTGAGGQLGATIVERFRRAGGVVIAATRAMLDVTRHDDVMRAVARSTPEVIVNCAAYNDVDAAEDRAALALDVNAFAVRSLARAAAEHGATLVHYSTDFVFDGLATEPYTERDPPRPESTYASSKYLGECFAREAPRHYVLRVESLFGGPAARSSIDRMIGQLTSGEPTRAFSDRVVSPSYVDDVAEATGRLLSTGAATGLYHCVNTGHTTWAGLARELARLVGAPETLVVPVRVADVALRARRPLFAALSNGKLAQAGVEMPAWEDALTRYVGARADSGRSEDRRFHPNL